MSRKQPDCEARKLAAVTRFAGARTAAIDGPARLKRHVKPATVEKINGQQTDRGRAPNINQEDNRRGMPLTVLNATRTAR